MPDALWNLAIYFSCATQALGGFILSVLATVLSFALPPLRKASDTQIRPFYFHTSRSAGSSISTVTTSTVPSTSSSSSSSTPRSGPSASDPIRTPHDSPDQPPTLPTRFARSRPSLPSLPDRALNFVLPPPSSQRPSSPPSSSEHRSRPPLAVKCAEQVKSVRLTPIDETKVAQPRPPTLRKGSSSSYLPHFGKRSTQPPVSSSADGVRPKGHRKLCRSVSLPSKASWHKERTVPERSQTAPVPVDKYPNISKAAPALPTPASAAPKRKYPCPRAPRRSRSLCSQSNASLTDASPKKTVVPLSRPPKHCRKPSASSSNSACTLETAPVSAALPSPPIARTRPYEAPYYFPTPASPEARNYVRNTRQLMRKASTVFQDIGDGLHSSTSPSPASALRGTAAGVATSPVPGLSVAQEGGNANSTEVVVGGSSDAAVMVDGEIDGRRKGKAKPITKPPKAVASALRR